MILHYFVLVCSFFLVTAAYSNKLFSISSYSQTQYDKQCINLSALAVLEDAKTKEGSNSSVVNMLKELSDPMLNFQNILHQFLFGPKIDQDKYPDSPQALHLKLKGNVDIYAHYPSGDLNRAEMFQGKSGVHMPPPEYLHRGHCRLKVTKDLMQTAINAFTILLLGNLQDIRHLPAEYVLNSARSIAMMKLTYEKLAETWKVVKGDKKPNEISHITLEKYRPLFKYVHGREIARLNLSDETILTYIGTHAELNRYQMGVVASRYMELNPEWSKPKYLNLLNNLLCGVPMSFMRKITSNIYLQLTDQTFYHIRACDPLQRQFYLAMMTRTAALGKSYSWSARDVARLGLLLAEVKGPYLASIPPEAMSGVTAQVMLEMSAENLQHITEVQIRYLGLKPLNIFARKVKAYQDQLKTLEANTAVKTMPILTQICCLLISIMPNFMKLF